MNDLSCDHPMSAVLATAGPMRRTCVHEAPVEWDTGLRQIRGINREAEPGVFLLSHGCMRGDALSMCIAHFHGKLAGALAIQRGLRGPRILCWPQRPGMYAIQTTSWSRRDTRLIALPSPPATCRRCRRRSVPPLSRIPEPNVRWTWSRLGTRPGQACGPWHPKYGPV